MTRYEGLTRLRGTAVASRNAVVASARVAQLLSVGDGGGQSSLRVSSKSILVCTASLQNNASHCPLESTRSPVEDAKGTMSSPIQKQQTVILTGQHTSSNFS